MTEIREDDEDGYNWLVGQFAAINTALHQAGLPLHQEPDSAPRTEYEMYGYSGLHCLRRLASYLWAKRPLPNPGVDTADDDPIMAKYYSEMGQPQPSFLAQVFGIRSTRAPRFGHLMMHSDAEGFYLPIDFERVIFPDEQLRIAGEMIGSSVRLMNECAALAASLDLPLTIDPDSDELWQAAERQGTQNSGWRAYGIESFTCARLWAACRASIATGSAIVFE